MWCKFFLFYLLFNIEFRNFGSAKPFAGDNVKSVNEYEYPFMVGVLRRTRFINVQRDTICTGSLISNQDILTAEHCLRNEVLNGVQLIIGSIDLLSGLKYYPSWWITYDPWAYAKSINNGFPSNDICIIRTTKLIMSEIIPAKILYLSYSELNGKKVTGVGWGKINNGTLPRVLHTASMKVMKKRACEERILRVGREALTVDPNLLCTIGVPFALMMNGDSGGPLLYRNKIVGISEATCPLPEQQFHIDKVNLYLVIKHYRDFIVETLSIF